jgi:hypothetical protein
MGIHFLTILTSFLDFFGKQKSFGHLGSRLDRFAESQTNQAACGGPKQAQKRKAPISPFSRSSEQRERLALFVCAPETTNVEIKVSVEVKLMVFGGWPQVRI